MTENEAIEILEERWRYSRTYKYTDAEIREAFYMAIKALGQQPCDDCISRKATIDAIYKKYIGGKDAIENASINDLYACGLEEAVDTVWDMPSVTPKAKTGQWIDVGIEGLVFECSICGIKKTIESHFCPNCGAKMEVEDNG